MVQFTFLKLHNYSTNTVKSFAFMLAILIAPVMSLGADRFLDPNLNYWFPGNSDSEVEVSGLKADAAASFAIPSSVVYEYFDYQANAWLQRNCSVIGVGMQALGSGRIASVSIPDSVRYLGYGAFDWSSNMTHVALGNGLREIGSHAFQGCSRLEAIRIPDSVTSIGNFAFVGCSNLTEATIGRGVVNFGDWVFRGCAGLKTVTFCDGLQRIGDGAFEGCVNLADVAIPGSVAEIGETAFKTCRGLTNLELNYGLKNIGDSAFNHCTALASVEIPDSVTNIGSYAFAGADSLTNVVIGSGVRTIHQNAFAVCGKLKSVKICGDVKFIGGYVFADCTNLATLYVPVSMAGSAVLAGVDLPSGCTVVYGDPCPVEFDTDGGVGGTSSVLAGYWVAMPVITLPTRTGYVFGGYWSGRNGTGTQYYTSEGTSARTWDLTSSTTLYAKWTLLGRDLACVVPSYGICASWEKAIFLASTPDAASGKSTFRPGETIYPHVVYCNLGSEDVSRPFTVLWGVNDRNDDYRAIAHTEQRLTNAVPSGGYRYWNASAWSGLQNLPPGDYSFVFALDWNVEIDEACETNNFYYVDFSVKTKTETAGGVPYAWLAGFGLGDGTEEGYEAAVAEKAANGINTVEECFVAGLDPTDPEVAFAVDVSFVDGMPVVGFVPDLGTERTYTVEGVENLGDTWGPINAATRFFRVKVALP